MKRKIFIFIFSLVLTASLGSFERIFACSCSVSTPAENYNSAEVVFVGKDIAATRQNTFTINGKTYVHDTGEVTFEISEAFVGVEKGAKVVINNDWAEMCGTVYERNEEYLIYARKDENGVLSAILCSRINLISYAKEDLEFFRNVLTKVKLATIFGSVKKSPDILSTVQIKIQFQNSDSKSEIFTAITDADGNFSVQVPKGIYTVTPIMPDNLTAEVYANKEINVKVGGAHRVFIYVSSEI